MLERAGHTVISATNERQVTDACSRQSIDVAVIGHSVTPKVKKGVLALIRERCPSARILELYESGRGKALEDADSWLETRGNLPDEFIERVGELASTLKRRQARR
jgi:hypothetical protein